MEKPLLDEYCKNILSVFLWSDKTLRFTELYKDLNAIGLKISRPTLTNHLHHLVADKLLIRKEEGKQNVSYTANWAKLETFQQSMKSRQALKNLLGNKKRFTTYPIEDQVGLVTNIMTLRDLYRLKLEVMDAIDPSKNFEHSIQYMYINRFFEFFKTWLLENCHESKTKVAPKALSMIDYNIIHFTNILFGKESQKHTNT